MNNLKTHRERKGFTQKQLSEASGVHINIISRIERGERGSDKLTLDTAAKLAKALNCHAEDLLDTEPNIKKENPLKQWRDKNIMSKTEFEEKLGISFDE